MQKIFIFQQLLGVSGQAGQLADRQTGMLDFHEHLLFLCRIRHH